MDNHCSIQWTWNFNIEIMQSEVRFNTWCDSGMPVFGSKIGTY